MVNRHLRPDETPVDLEDDLDRAPGISQSGVLFARTGAEDAKPIDGDDMAEGDTGKDGTAAGGLDPLRARGL